MPCYDLQCENPACRLSGEKVERFMRHTERAGTKCDACGQPMGTHADQFASVAVQREWSRGRGGIERTSLEIAFDKNADIASIKRDCPSMELRRRGDMLRPVFRNDAHHRRTMKEFAAAVDRYEAIEGGGRIRVPITGRGKQRKAEIVERPHKAKGITR